MTWSLAMRSTFAAMVSASALLGAATVSAADAPPDAVFELPAGTACAAFDVTVEVRGGTQVAKEFTDKNGNVVRRIAAGKGSELTFINVATGESLALPANGSVTHVSLRPDGSSTWVTTGHNVLILFPTDVPAGPSTTLYVGRVVVTVDSDGVFAVTDTNGTSTDICVALSG